VSTAWIGAAVVTLLAAASGKAGADRIERGVVVRLEGDSLYIDVSTARGATAGRPLRLKRRVELRPPGTGRAGVGELPVGGEPLKLSDAGAYLSRVVAPAPVLPLVRVGDIAEVLVHEARPPRREPPRAPEPPAPRLDPHKAAVLRMWQTTAGRPVAERIAAWQQFLADHPTSPHAPLLRAELEHLRTAQEELLAPVRDPGQLSERWVRGFEHLAAPAAPVGEPLAVAFLARVPIGTAWLHYRTAGGDTFRRLPLRRDGDAYLRGRIPAGAVQAPGVEYFVEAVDPGGQWGAAVATAREPVAVRVDPAPARWFTEKRSRSRVSTSVTYLDYATFDDRDGDHTDRYFLIETDFLYRLQAGPLHGVRSGFGVLHGQGGRIAAPDPGDDPERAGFTYGYVEVELHPPDMPLALLARGVTGLGEEGVGFGAEGRLRLGGEQATNVTFAASTLEDIGFLSEIRMQFVAVPQVPIGLAVAVSDQPNQGDLGVRTSVDVGWRALPWVSPMLRLSYQGRSVRHSGVGGGLSMVFDW
jgi:hypothetical protein